MRERAMRRLELHAEMARALVDEQLAGSVERVAALIAQRYQAGATLLLFGNGGSAADAQHIATELTGRYLLDRAPLPALALADNTASLTAIGNDFGFEQVFARQVRAFGRKGDVAIALSTSGSSANVLAGLAAAREEGLATVGVTGPRGDLLAELCDHCIRIPAEQTPQIQEGTMLVLHTICELVEHDLFAG
ncbi:MAG: D-sedoheptulose 7-phosphate isomerase [Gaiellales bacterium]|nr:D-sedoheptulose 7-phosphate isomerase [Gaiellales bacterium]